MKTQIFENPKIVLVLQSILLLSILIVPIILGINRQNDLDQQIISQEIEKLSSTIEDFVQTGQVFLNEYASNLEFSDNTESLVLQLRNDLLPFPFFSQLNIVDANGVIIAGFPQNAIGQRIIGLTSNNLVIDSSQTGIISKKQDSSLFLFIKSINREKSYSLIGESDLRANPLNSAFTLSLSEMMKKGIVVSFLDSSHNSFLRFRDTSKTTDSREFQIVEKELVIPKWILSLGFPITDNSIKVLIDETPLVLLILFFEGFLVLNYFSKVGKNISAESPDRTSGKLFPRNERIESYKSRLLKTSSLDEMGNLLLDFAEVEEDCSIRLVFFENPYSLNRGCNTSFAAGKNSKEYTYLDEQISELLKGQADLEITDLHDFKDIHLNPEKPFPMAIYASPIRSGKIENGLIWYGFNEPRLMQVSEKKFIQELIEAGKRIIVNLIHYKVYKDISLTQNLIMEALPYPVFMTDNQNNILYFNQVSTKNFDVGEVQTNKKIQDVFKNSLPEAIAKGQGSGSFQFTHADGSIFRVRIESSLENGNQKRIYIFENISEQEIRENNLGEVTALLSHDLRVPLTTLKGYLSMLPVMGPVNQQQRNYVEKGIRQIDEMNDLVKNLLVKEKLDSKFDDKSEPIWVDDVLEEIVHSLQPLIDQKRIVLVTDFRENPNLKIKVEKWLLKIAIRNIFENAIRFTPNQGKIIVRKNKVQDLTEISIEDSGVGIAAVDLPHIFEKSYRMKIKSDSNTSENGQSLALVKSIIEKLGGEIGAVSELGKGSTFFIRLPIAKE